MRQPPAVKRPPFRLYPTEQHWWGFGDYGTVLGVMDALQPTKILEFGPGWSTRALIEGGAESIDCCEDNPDWFKTHSERLVVEFPTIVTMHLYTWSDPLNVPSLGRKRYDLALIDGPHGTLQRPAVLEFCLQRCKAVLIPSEDIAYGRSALRPHIESLAEKYSREITWIESGPLSGAFALLEKPQRWRNPPPPAEDIGGVVKKGL